MSDRSIRFVRALPAAIFSKRSSALAAGGSIAASLGPIPAVHAQGSEAVNVALIGCGGRGSGAAIERDEGRSEQPPDGDVRSVSRSADSGPQAACRRSSASSSA